MRRKRTAMRAHTLRFTWLFWAATLFLMVGNGMDALRSPYFPLLLPLALLPPPLIMYGMMRWGMPSTSLFARYTFTRKSARVEGWLLRRRIPMEGAHLYAVERRGFGVSLIVSENPLPRMRAREAARRGDTIVLTVPESWRKRMRPLLRRAEPLPKV